MKRITTGGRKGEIQKLVHVERVNGQWRSTLEKIKEKGEWWGSLITRGAPGVFVDKDGGGGGRPICKWSSLGHATAKKKKFPSLCSLSVSLGCTNNTLLLSLSTVYQSEEKKREGRGYNVS